MTKHSESTYVNVLVADDDSVQLDILKRKLVKCGFMCHGLAKSKDELLELVEKSKPDVVLLDIHFPHKEDGLQSCEAMQVQHGVPVVFVTGYPRSKATSLIEVVKPYGVLFKPVNEKQLSVAIHSANNRRLAEIKLENMISEKNCLLREIHHRVKNNLQIILSFISLEASRQEEEQPKELLDKLQLRIKAISTVHEQLYKQTDMASIDIETYIVELVQRIAAMNPGSSCNVCLEIEARQVSVPIDKAVTLGLILSELVSNAFKYAFTSGQGFLTIKLHEAEGLYSLTVSDNGPGLPIDFSLDHEATLGVQLIKVLSGQLRGEVSFASDHGAHFTVTFPTSPSC